LVQQSYATRLSFASAKRANNTPSGGARLPEDDNPAPAPVLTLYYICARIGRALLMGVFVMRRRWWQHVMLSR
jgi:hypothetical protein